MSEPVSRRAVLAGAGAGVVLAGCGLSADRTVRPGLSIDGPTDGGVAVRPPGPVEGASPEQIISGFLRAGATSGPELAVARSFLTEQAQTAWRPDQQTVVYGSTAPTISRADQQTYRVRLRDLVARIDGDARYATAPPGEALTLEFGLAEVGGQWRISSVPQDFGRALHTVLVGRMYRSYLVHYPVIGWNSLVADLRWIPQDQQSTRLARAQLGPVPRYLAGAAHTDQGARLSVDAVPIIGGSAQVDLRAAGLSQDVTVRTNLAAQFVATLMQLPGVTDIEMSVEGQVIQLPDVEPPLTSPEQLGFVVRTLPRDATALVLTGGRAVPVPAGRLLRVTADDLSSASTPFPSIGGTWRHLALSADAKEVTGIDPSATEVTRWREDGSRADLPFFADRLVRPRYDGGGVLWVGGRGSGATAATRVFAINATVDPSDPRSRPAPIPISWLTGRRVRALDISPDGSRIAVVSTASDGTRVDVAGITRQANGLPTGTSREPLRIAARLTDVVDVVWTTAQQIAVIGRRESTEARGAFLCDVGGEITALPKVPSAESVTSTSGPRELIVGSANGSSYQRSGQRFVRLSLPKGAIVAVAGR